MVYRPNVQNDLCFVLLPLSNPFLGYFEKLIMPACAEVGLIAVKADDVYGTRAVIQDIWDYIWKAKVIIAIVTGRNPNVNYELGICHTLGIPSLLLTNSADDVPFDYRHRRYIKYDTTEAGWEDTLRTQVVMTLKAVLDPAAAPDASLPWPYNTSRLVKSGEYEEIGDETGIRAAVLEGIESAGSLIRASIGPEGKCVMQKKPFGNSVLVREGLQLLGSLSSSNVLRNQGLDAMKSLANDVKFKVGDYTKTAIIIGAALVRFAQRELDSGKNLNQLISGMEEAVRVANAFIRTRAIPIDRSDLLPLAMSASRNRVISELVIDALEKAGSDGVIDVAESSADSHSLDFAKGMHFDRGYKNPGFVNDPINKECVLTDCKILLYEQRITSLRDLLPILHQVALDSGSLLIIAGDVEGEALATLLVNVEKGRLQSVAVQSPGLGDRRRATMEDIAVYTGATALFQETGRQLAQVLPGDLGHAAQVIVTQNSTTIIGGGGNPALVSDRIQSLRQDIERTVSSYDSEKLRERLARLSSGVVTINIGGATESDRADGVYSARSALNSCMLGLKHGVIVGGGVTLLGAERFVATMAHGNASQAAGGRAVQEALKEPARALLHTAKSADVEAALSVLAAADSMQAFDVVSACVADARMANIFDPSEAIRNCLSLAMSHCRAVIQASSWTDQSGVSQGFVPPANDDVL